MGHDRRDLAIDRVLERLVGEGVIRDRQAQLIKRGRQASRAGGVVADRLDEHQRGAVALDPLEGVVRAAKRRKYRRRESALPRRVGHCGLDLRDALPGRGDRQGDRGHGLLPEVVVAAEHVAGEQGVVAHCLHLGLAHAGVPRPGAGAGNERFGNGGGSVRVVDAT